MKPKFEFLRQAEQGEGTAGGGAGNIVSMKGAEGAEGPTGPKGVAGPPGDPGAADPAAAQPTLLDGVLGAMKSKGALVAQIGDLKGQVSAAEVEVLQLKASVQLKDGELGTLRAQLATLQAERAQIAAALEASQKEVRTVEDAALVQIGGLGFSAEALPEAAQEGAQDSVAALEKQLAAETDPQRIFTLNEKLNAAKVAAKAG